MKKPLPLLSLDSLEGGRRDAAAFVAGSALELVGLVPERGADLVSSTLAALDVYAGPALTNPLTRFLARPLERFVRPRRLSARSGTTVLVRDAGRYDLVEVLIRAQAALRATELQLVPTTILFEEAVRSYEWRGTLVEFTLSAGVNWMVPQYVAWHPDVGYGPVKQKGPAELRLRSVAHKS